MAPSKSKPFELPFPQSLPQELVTVTGRESFRLLAQSSTRSSRYSKRKGFAQGIQTRECQSKGWNLALLPPRWLPFSQIPKLQSYFQGNNTDGSPGFVLSEAQLLLDGKHLAPRGFIKARTS